MSALIEIKKDEIVKEKEFFEILEKIKNNKEYKKMLILCFYLKLDISSIQKIKLYEIKNIIKDWKYTKTFSRNQIGDLSIQKQITIFFEKHQIKLIKKAFKKDCLLLADDELCFKSSQVVFFASYLKKITDDKYSILSLKKI